MSESQSVLTCLYCGSHQLDGEFYDIFDEVSVELQLDKLLEQYFLVRVLPNEKEQQVLCDGCVNRLIELYDESEFSKQQVENASQSNDFMEEQQEEDAQKEAGFKSEIVFVEVEQNAPISLSNSSDNLLLQADEEFYSEDEILTEEDVIKDDGNSVEADDEYNKNDDISMTELIVFHNEGQKYDNHSATYDELSAEDDAKDEDENPIATMQDKRHTFEFEVDCSEEIDIINIDSYLDSTINSILEGLQFAWNSQCTICLQTFQTYQAVLKHILLSHKKEEQFVCVIDDCKGILSNEKLLARHIILRHCDLQNLQIYGNCPHCDLRYSNFALFNKHSCCRSLKRVSGMRHSCEICKIEFHSFKRFIFHLQFHLVKRRPKVCLICESSFSDANDFFEHVQYSHEPKEKLACNICDRTFKEKDLLEAHKICHKQKQPKFGCNYCPKKYDYKNLLQIHMNVCHSDIMDGKLEITCDICGEVFANEINYRKHKKSHNMENEVQGYVCTTCGIIARDKEDLSGHVGEAKSACLSSTIQQEIFSTAYNCEFCSLDFKTANDLKLHRSNGTHANGIYECPLCKKQFNELKSMRIHTKSHSTYSAWLNGFPLCRVFMCDVEDCEETYPQWTALYHHKRRHHKSQTCTSCNQYFVKAKDFAKHKQLCEKNANFICQFCDKVCPSKMSLSIHITRSHNNKYVICPTCSSSYKDEKVLQEHINNMHVPVKCKYCHKVIKNQQNFQMHLRVVHKNEQRFFCQICQKGFYFKSEKNAHEKNIHAEIIHKCTECSFTTNYANSLEVHMARHNQIYNYQCPICKKEFSRKHVLNIHIKRHQIKREFACADRIVNGCGASFITNYLLNKHIKQKHAKPMGRSNHSSSVNRLKEGAELSEADVDDVIEIMNDEEDVIELELNEIVDTDAENEECIY